MIQVKLKKYLFLHMLSGFALGSIIIMVFLISIYHNSIIDALNKMNQIVVNASNMKQSIDNIDSVIKKVSSLLPNNYPAKSHKEILLTALDGIKMTFKDEDITVVSFEEKGDSLLLKINIKTAITSYRNFVKKIEYLQSIRFPSFHFETILIERSSDKKKDDVMTCKIEGILKMPAERLRVKI